MPAPRPAPNPPARRSPGTGERPGRGGRFRAGYGPAVTPSPAAPVGHVPVEHRWLGLDRRTLAPGLGVLLLALLWAVVLPAVNEAVPDDREVGAGTVLVASHGVTVVPPVGW